MLRTLPIAFVASASLASSLHAQAVLAAVGDAVLDGGGTPLGSLASIEAFGVTSATDWAVLGTLAGAPSGADEVLVDSGGLLLREGDVAPGPNPNGATITGFDALAKNASGQLAYVVEVGPASGDAPYEVLFLDGRPLLRTGLPANLSTVPVGSTYADLVAVRLARGDASCAARLLVRVDVDTILGTSEQLVEVRTGCGVTPQPTITAVWDGGLCLSPSCGQTTGGLSLLGETPDGFATNQAGDVLVHAGTPLGGGVAVIGWNGVVDACDACSVCAATLQWEVVHEQVALADDGTRAVRGRLSGGDEVVMVDGCTVAVRVGDAPAGLPAPIDGLGRVHLAEDGTLFWYGTFADAANGGGAAIFRGSSALVRRGTTSIAGSTVATIVDAPGSFHTTGRTGLVAFRGTLADGTDGVFVVPTTPPFVPWAVVPALGCTTANTASLTLAGGTTRVGDFFLLRLDGAQGTGAVPQLFFANQPYTWPFDPATSCGGLWAGGEALLNLGGPNPVFGPVGVPWQPGAPPLLGLGAPSEALNLVGETWYVQGLFYDLQGTSSPSEPIRSTNALAVTFGSP